MNNLARTGKQPGDKKRLTVAVAAIAVVVIVAVALVFSGRPKNVYKLSPESVTKVAVAGRVNLELERKDRGWLLTEPITWPADATRMEQIISFVSGPRGRKAGSAGSNLAKYGLDNPIVKVGVVAGSESHVILIGGRVPRKAAHYVKLEENNKVWEVSEGDLGFFTQPETSYRSRNLVDLDSELVSLQIVRGEETIVLRRRDDGKWQVIRPIQDDGDEEAVKELLEYLGSVQIRDFLDEPGELSEYGLEEPAAKIIAITGDGEKIEVSIGDVAGLGVRYARNAAFDSVVTVTGVRFAPLHIQAEQLIDQSLLDFDVSDVVGLRIRDVDSDISFRKIDGVWYIHPDTDAQAMVFHINALLGALLDVRVEAVVSSEVVVADDELESSRFDVELADGRKLWLRVLLPKEGVGEGFVQVATRPHYFRIYEFASMLLARRIASVSTSIIDLPIEDCIGLLVMTPEVVAAAGKKTPEPVEFKFDEENAVWKSGRDVFFGVEDFSGSLTEILVDRVAPKLEKEEDYGFAVEKGGIWYQASTDRDSVKMEIGGATEEGKYRYLRVSGRPDVFLAESDSITQVIDTFGRLRTNLLQINDELLVRLEIYKGGQEYRVEKSGGKWLDVGASDIDALVKAMNQIGVQAAAVDADPETYKFYPDPVGVRVVFVYEDGSEDSMDLGNRMMHGVGWFASYRYFLRATGDTVYYVADAVGKSINTAVDNFIKKIQ
ncbi:MAG: DUF4340 domain-containing protein [Limnochordia bacterium]|nr:DUF4340 domain-containing protein [Limnochordia bacterium]